MTRQNCSHLQNKKWIIYQILPKIVQGMYNNVTFNNKYISVQAINYNLLLLNVKTYTGIQEHIIIVAFSTESLKEFIIIVYSSLFKDKHNLVNLYFKTLIMIYALSFYKLKSNATQLAHLREANTHFQLIAASPTRCPSSGLYKTHHHYHQR